MEDTSKRKEADPEQPKINPEEDGRNKEWQERSRVNLEEVPEGTKTNIERDFEPEDLNDNKVKGQDSVPPY